MFSLQNVCLQLGDFSLADVSLCIEQGEYRILLGSTGTGKTILFETIAGLHIPQSGRVILHDTDITREAPEDRNIGVVYQDYALFPHLNVYENIAFGLKLQKKTQQQITQDVCEIAEFFNISHLLKRSQRHLSGGECQRVALARTLVLRPDLLLLDEPLSAVDSKTRTHLRQELQRINKELGQTILHITHDLSEAFLLGQTMTVMHNGKILQNGTPESIIRQPATRLVAELMGIKNFLPASWRADKTLHIQGLGRCSWQESLENAKPPLLVTFPDWAVEVNPQNSPSSYIWQGDCSVKNIQATDNQLLVTLMTADNQIVYTAFSRRESDQFGSLLQPGQLQSVGICADSVHILANT
jgi:ABC-type Fe3+/spermidine/putrescine transport system ATPase subunit